MSSDTPVQRHFCQALEIVGNRKIRLLQLYMEARVGIEPCIRPSEGAPTLAVINPMWA